jgi:ubiquinone/menaquinone biosynthesis C-methylase UbiE
MDFDSGMGAVQRRMAQTQEGVGRRKATFEALCISAGQHVLDLGCGGGHLLRDLALSVGSKGRAVGLDPSEPQINAAKELCKELDNVEFSQDSATELSFADDTFHSVASIQVLEYIPDVDAALAEVRRVLKAGGRFATVSVLWDHWRFHGPEPKLNDQMHEAFKAHCSHQMLPLQMPGKLARHGFVGAQCVPIGFMNNSLHHNSFAWLASSLFTHFAEKQGIPEGEIQRWREQLDQAVEDGRFGFVSMPVLTTAIAG